MESCWKWLNSLTPWRSSMKCSYCKRIEWRNHKTIEEFDLEGCMRCRLIMGNDLLSEPDLSKREKRDIWDCKVYGRYD